MGWSRVPFVCLTVISLGAMSAGDALCKTLHVNIHASPGGDGSGKWPFHNIAEAVAAADDLGGDTIKIAPGRYEVSSPIYIEKPLILKGSNEMAIDEDGRPTGSLVPGTETRIVYTAGVGNNPVLGIGRQDLQPLSGVTISNLSLEGGLNTVQIFKTQDFAVKDCLITNSNFIGIYSALSSGRISGNYITRAAASGIIAGAGNADSPAYVEVLGNRSVQNRLGGFLANGSGTDVDEFADELYVVVRNNDFSDNKANLVTSFGIRLFVLRRDLGDEQDTQSTGNIHALIHGNRIVGNTTGITVDAGFPYRVVGGVCDTREYSGNIFISLKGNEVAGNLRAPALVTFTRHLSAFNQGTLNAWQYLHNTRFEIEDSDESIVDYWLDHPERDPYPFTGVGACLPQDETNELLGNVFIYNGVEVPHGRTVP